jgi:hypothetical protein
LEDCIALSDLLPDEVDPIAVHEHLPEIVAAELGCYLVHCANGRQAIKAIIRDDIEAARARSDFRRAASSSWCSVISSSAAAPILPCPVDGSSPRVPILVAVTPPR